MDQAPFILWLQGPTSAGKTTLAQLFVRHARASGHRIIHFDGDEIRDLFPASHGFAAEDRMKVVNALIHLANKCREAGLNVVISALTAHPEARALVRSRVVNLISGLVVCSLETCAARDPKGLYRRAASGQIDTLIGINQPYIPPSDPDIVLDSEHQAPLALVEQLIQRLFPGKV